MSEKPQVKLGAGTSKVAALTVAMLDSQVNYMFPTNKSQDEIMQELTALLPDAKVRAQVASLIIQVVNAQAVAISANYTNVVTAVYPRLEEVLSNQLTVESEAKALMQMYQDTLPSGNPEEEVE